MLANVSKPLIASEGTSTSSKPLAEYAYFTLEQMMSLSGCTEDDINLVLCVSLAGDDNVVDDIMSNKIMIIRRNALNASA